MSADGRYVYCIMEGGKSQKLGDIGLFGNEVYTINHIDISAVVSKAPFKKVKPDVDSIIAHQRVVEASKNVTTTLPVRFGILFKSEQDIKKLLTKSYNDFKSKINKLKDKEEFGIKLILEKESIRKIQKQVIDNSEEIKKIKKEIRGSESGTAYFLNMRMSEAIKNEMLRKVEELGGEVHRELASCCVDSCFLKVDMEDVILNAAYLVNKSEIKKFDDKLEKLKRKYGTHGLIFHQSGPWAPYSFC